MHRIAVAIAAFLSIFLGSPASAQVVITQAKALAGNVTPGDTAGYPITISQPGAYRLESNLTVPSGTYAMFVGADHVDIDLNGFLITGDGVATYGIISNRREGRIRNGAVSLFKFSGIYLRGDGWTIDDMKVSRNGFMGVDATDSRLLKLQSSLLTLNSYYGIETGDAGLFLANQITNNGQKGIRCEESCHAEGNIIDQNGQDGITFKSGLAIGNTITRNTVQGLYDNSAPQNDFGFTNNMLVNNSKNAANQNQAFSVVPLDPNRCTPKSC